MKVFSQGYFPLGVLWNRISFESSSGHPWFGQRLSFKVVLIWELLSSLPPSSGDCWQCPGTFLIIMTWGVCGEMLLVPTSPHGYRPEMLLNTLQCIGQLPTIIWFKMLRNLALGSWINIGKGDAVTSWRYSSAGYPQTRKLPDARFVKKLMSKERSAMKSCNVRARELVFLFVGFHWEILTSVYLTTLCIVVVALNKIQYHCCIWFLDNCC